MEKIDFMQQFAERLRQAMISAGFNSRRSPSGVNIKKLAEITNHSLQICRKYLRGEVIPDPVKLAEVAKVLHVTPGWLLFGDGFVDTRVENHINISKSLLHHLLSEATSLYHSERSGADVTDFLVDLIQNISQMGAEEAQSKQIIDLALSSIRRFGF